MLRDDTIDAIELDVASKLSMPLNEVQSVMDFYYDHILERIKDPEDFRTVKIDYFGKIMFNPHRSEKE